MAEYIAESEGVIVNARAAISVMVRQINPKVLVSEYVVSF
jgi:hypothetical protein